MLAVLTLSLALQVQVRVGKQSDKDRADSLKRVAIMDSVRFIEQEHEIDRERRTPRRIPLTPELERTAFIDPGARSLLLNARAARLRQDSSLLSYDAKAYQRLSVGLGFRAIGRERLLFRTENASRVRWSRTNGVYIDMNGARTAIPMLSQRERKAANEDGELADVNNEMSPIPYYPGREALWVGSGAQTRAEVDERDLVHPIALGSEAYYRYSSGDSLTITLSDGKAIKLRELRVEPRRPEWKLSVGSFWFDVSTGQLVRAVYRLAVPIDIWGLVDEETKRDREDAKARGGKPDPDDDVPKWVKGMMSPMQANLEAVTIEYGLYGGRFWLPRAQYAEGWARASFMRIPFKMEENFKYNSVNGTDSTPSVPGLMTRRQLRDSLFGHDTTRWSDLPDSVRKDRTKRLVAADSVRREQQVARRKNDCATTGYWTRIENREDSNLRTAIRLPCDTAVLSHSPDLPPSIYDAGEETFGSSERDELLKALDFSLQPVWAPQPIRLAYGLDQTRYNRVEGLSLGGTAMQNLGKGYTWDAAARFGFGDLHPNGELGLSRSNGRTSWRAAGYHRLAVANDDWGSPLSFGASLGALLYGRDEGYYYRTTGAELTRTLVKGGGLTTRFFVQRDGRADTGAAFNLSKAFGGGSRFSPNIRAERATLMGASLRQQFSHGVDPLGWRLFGDLRGEGGWIASSEDSVDSRAYGRVAGDMTVTRGFGALLAGAFTVSGGVSDNAPIQRAFFLGGAQTVRGQLLGSAVGDA
ncbi:MAG: hypothetical protein ABIT38_22705, partial [Gemmatimonadaceae bacterium]